MTKQHSDGDRGSWFRRTSGLDSLSAVLIVVTLALLAVWMRSIGADEAIFVEHIDGAGSSVVLRGTDSWHHLRVAEGTAASFPRPLRYDPLLVHPGGGAVRTAPVLSWLVAATAWLVQPASPAQHLAVIAAWLPAVVGGLLVIPVFMIAGLSAGRTAALAAATLVACLPTAAWRRSLVGASDHHVFEMVGATMVVASFMASARAEKASESQRWALLAGLSLSFYLASWRSGGPIALVILGWLLLAPALNRLSRLRDSRWSIRVRPWLWTHSAFGLLLAAGLVSPLLAHPGVPRASVLFPLVAGSLLLLATRAPTVCRVLQSTKPVALRFVSFLTLSSTGLALCLAFASAGLLDSVQRLLDVSPWRYTVSEMRPWLSGTHLWSSLWSEFGFSAVLATVGLFVTCSSLRRNRCASNNGTLLLLLWLAVSLGLSLLQRRFLYYLAPVVMILTGIGLAALLAWLPFPHRCSRRSQTGVRAALLVGTLLLLILGSLTTALDVATTNNGPSAAWKQALNWLRANSPDPLVVDPQQPTDGELGETAKEVESSYGVLSWWDRGHWISQIARRPPIANPEGTGASKAAEFLLAEDEGTAVRILRETGARYVVVDAELTMRPGPGEIALGDFASIPRWLGEVPQRYFERFEIRDREGSWQPLYVYYPGYFRTMAIRLQEHPTPPVEPTSPCWIIGYRLATRADDALVKRIVTLRRESRSAHSGGDNPSQLEPPAPEDLESGVVHEVRASLDPSQPCDSPPDLTRLKRLATFGSQPDQVLVYEARL